MTEIIYISGVHGAGKTTIIQLLSRKLQKAGLSVYVFPEMSFIPDIEIGTYEFQLWYKKQLRLRNRFIRNAIDYDYGIDYIICDRHLFDSYIYDLSVLDIDFDPLYVYNNSYLGNSLSGLSHYFIIVRDFVSIKESIVNRLEQEEHRKHWNETDEGYLKWIYDAFLEMADTFDDFHLVDNTSIERSANIILDSILLQD